MKEWLAVANAAPARSGSTERRRRKAAAGKVYMIRAGLFDDVDAVVSWHPGDLNECRRPATSPTSAPSSASAACQRTPRRAPDQGRSALDGVEAMNTW